MNERVYVEKCMLALLVGIAIKTLIWRDSVLVDYAVSQVAHCKVNDFRRPDVFWIV
jgi:hypothetical protein